MARKKQLPDAAEPTVTALGYPQCEWRSDTIRCLFPGSLSPSCTGGAFFCSGHFGCTDPIAGADIVQASKDYVHPSTRQNDDAQLSLMQAELQCRGLLRRDEESMRDYRIRLGKARVRKSVGTPGLGWAEKILTRAASGESVNVTALRMAEDAVAEAARPEPELSAEEVA